jgi:chaperone required for assembly of F1-ATPase
LDISCIRFQDMLRQLDPKQIKMICKLSLKYPPSTRALLGALLEQTNISFDQDEIKHTLNPITRYRFTGIDKVLSNYKSWNLL